MKNSQSTVLWEIVVAEELDMLPEQVADITWEERLISTISTTKIKCIWKSNLMWFIEANWRFVLQIAFYLNGWFCFLYSILS